MVVSIVIQEVIADFSFPVHVITKSDLVTRDIDLLKRISERYAAVSFTVTCAQDSLSAKIEPSAPLTSNITTIIQRAADCGASYIIPMFGVTMRKGSREYLYNKLDSIAPGLSLLRQNLWRKIRMFFARLYQPTKGL